MLEFVGNWWLHGVVVALMACAFVYTCDSPIAELELIHIESIEHDNGGFRRRDIAIVVSGRPAYSEYGHTWMWVDTGDRIKPPLSTRLGGLTDDAAESWLDFPQPPPEAVTRAVEDWENRSDGEDAARPIP